MFLVWQIKAKPGQRLQGWSPVCLWSLRDSKAAKASRQSRKVGVVALVFVVVLVDLVGLVGQWGQWVQWICTAGCSGSSRFGRSQDPCRFPTLDLPSPKPCIHMVLLPDFLAHRLSWPSHTLSCGHWKPRWSSGSSASPSSSASCLTGWNCTRWGLYQCILLHTAHTHTHIQTLDWTCVSVSSGPGSWTQKNVLGEGFYFEVHAWDTGSGVCWAAEGWVAVCALNVAPWKVAFAVCFFCLQPLEETKGCKQLLISRFPQIQQSVTGWNWILSVVLSV